ncbi:MAG: phosphoribosylformylglycinamidine cyclo-ligase [archaeon]|nr:phosphoribosylformylglycinamidine cyclo-ligase [archaeon]
MKSVTYAGSGVDIKKEERAVKSIASVISSTFSNRAGKTGEVKSSIGHFANFVEVGDKYIVMATDGVGTKVLVAQMARKFDTVGIDMVAMNVNDIICVGAEPVALVDYLAVEKIDDNIALVIAKGIRDGANDAGVAVIGGETASLKGVVTGIDGMGFDLAGTCVGIVDKDRVVLGDKVRAGDKVIGIASSGIHSNGYSLARKVILGKYKISDKLPWGAGVADELLMPTKIYVKPVLDVLSKHFDSVTGLCHITGGGLLNLKRLNGIVGFRLDEVMDAPRIFGEIRKLGNVPVDEMFRTFNMGMGFVVVCRADACGAILGVLRKWKLSCKVVGEVTEKKGVVEVPQFKLEL